MWSAEIGLAPVLVAEKLVGKVGDDLFGPLRGNVLSGDTDRISRGPHVSFQLVGELLSSLGIETKTLVASLDIKFHGYNKYS